MIQIQKRNISKNRSVLSSNDSESFVVYLNPDSRFPSIPVILNRMIKFKNRQI